MTDETGLARYYAKLHGSAAAAVEKIEAANYWHDATTRMLLRDLEQMRHEDRLAAQEASAMERAA